MNRYPLWKYVLLAFALVIGLVYTLPNLFGQSPAVQVSSGKVVVKVDGSLVGRVQQALDAAGLKPDYVQLEGNSVRARLADTDAQLKAKDVIGKALNADPADPSYIVALNLVSRSPQWLASLHALPMNLGLDLQGGVHFLMQVDMKAALTKKAESLTGDIRTLLRDKNVRHSGISRDGNTVTVNFRDEATRSTALGLLSDSLPDVQWTPQAGANGDLSLSGALKPAEAIKVQQAALKQNITTLHNRVNELGVAEPVIQQQGLDRVVVQLPGVQDTAKAKDIIGRTATLELRMVDDSAEAAAAATGSGPVPFGTERYVERGGRPLIVKRQVILTGDNLADAQPGFDDHQQPAVHLKVDAKGTRIMRDISRDNVGKRMAILLFEKGKGEVITAPVIRGELGASFQISGSMTTQEATDTALLLRAGSLAAPMEIIEERTIGPSLGADNIAKGFHSLTYGFAAIAVFMCLYYLLFGVFSTLALAFNLLMLVAMLSMMQATLTLPGIAAIALALGMAIDANVLINERVREELRNGSSPQAAIHAGYERAFATILDSNITTLIAGVALLAFGSGPVRGFAVVHCLGIVTSMFSAVMFSRGLVNLWYGRQKKLKSVSIGQIWRPAGAAGASTSTEVQPSDAS
ncbi:protein translocase subunit SecD [Ideonella azotifigens]|uniref:Protein translocase subunit SecD n=1 Tax=Ideonella azotifigens TaxID=513160 RepID=A0ABP3VHC8_9BURK|nr:protein translocase subunit SecD [Ideonella azotifigens]MCD2339015.1 protein translocase subunit SecD [Ideonella azotifigens]